MPKTTETTENPASGTDSAEKKTGALHQIPGGVGTAHTSDAAQQKSSENGESPESESRNTEPANPESGTNPDSSGEAEPETFDREYVEKLRKEAAEHRVKAKRADDLAKELFHARVGALGRLADPDDLPYDDKLLSDLPALEAAVEDLISRKPHLAARTPRGDVGQGSTKAAEGVDLAAILRGAL